jgi:hypothetical protein
MPLQTPTINPERYQFKISKEAADLVTSPDGSRFQVDAVFPTGSSGKDGSNAHIIINFDLSHDGTPIKGNCNIGMDLADAEWLVKRLSDSIASMKARATASGS